MEDSPAFSRKSVAAAWEKGEAEAGSFSVRISEAVGARSTFT